MFDSNNDCLGSLNLPDVPPICAVVGTCLFRVFVLFEMPMTISPELLERCEHLILKKSSKCLIVEIKHKKALERKKITC